MHVHAFNRFLYKKYIVSQYSKKHQQDISNQKKKKKIMHSSKVSIHYIHYPIYIFLDVAIFRFRDPPPLGCCFSIYFVLGLEYIYW